MITNRQLARRRQRRQRTVFVLALVLVAFTIGVAVGEAIHDNPRPGGTQTTIITLNP